MKLYITSAYPFHPKDNFAVAWLKESAENDPYKTHSITNNIEEADIVLFAEHHPPSDPYFFKVLKHPILKKHKKKTLIYHDNPYPIAILPTLSPSIEKSFYNVKNCISAPYIARHVENESVTFSAEEKDKKYLFSFLGASRTHAVRKEVLKLNHPDAFLKDTSDKDLWLLSPEEKKKFENQFVDVSKESHFVLCPRGVGVNSYRLFEVMQMGLVPVIISDEWVPSSGPDWESFSIRVPENEVHTIPELLAKKKQNSFSMGMIARKNWEQWFAKDVCFHHIANLSKELMEKKSNNRLWRFKYAYSQFLRPFHFRNLLRFYKRKIVK